MQFMGFYSIYLQRFLRAHNPEVVGSNPAPATRKPLISFEIGGFSFEKVLFFEV